MVPQFMFYPWIIKTNIDVTFSELKFSWPLKRRQSCPVKKSIETWLCQWGEKMSIKSSYLYLIRLLRCRILSLFDRTCRIQDKIREYLCRTGSCVIVSLSTIRPHILDPTSRKNPGSWRHVYTVYVYFGVDGLIERTPKMLSIRRQQDRHSLCDRSPLDAPPHKIEWPNSVQPLVICHFDETSVQ